MIDSFVYQILLEHILQFRYFNILLQKPLVGNQCNKGGKKPPFIPVRIATIKKTTNIKHWPGVEKRKPLCTIGAWAEEPGGLQSMRSQRVRHD